LAPTGVVAFNINSATIYSVFSILIATKDVELTGERLKQLQICDLPIYAKNSRLSNPISEDKRLIYSQFGEIYKLEVVQCQAGESDELITRPQENLPLSKQKAFLNITCLLPKWKDIAEFNKNKLRLKSEILLAKGACVMLSTNFWTTAGLVNRAMRTIEDIIFNNNRPTSLPTAILISFEKYNRPTITISKGIRVVPIALYNAYR
ncbi:19042_t:CDS:2, partial [Racocetra persica]